MNQHYRYFGASQEQLTKNISTNVRWREEAREFSYTNAKSTVKFNHESIKMGNNYDIITFTLNFFKNSSVQSGPHNKPIPLSLLGERPGFIDGSDHSTSPGIKFNPSHGGSRTDLRDLDNSSKEPRHKVLGSGLRLILRFFLPFDLFEGVAGMLRKRPPWAVYTRPPIIEAKGNPSKQPKHLRYTCLPLSPYFVRTSLSNP